MEPVGSGGLRFGALFAVSLALAACLNVAISMFVYILTFIMLSPAGARLVVTAAADFLAGGLVAIPMMPDWLQRIVYCFPFHYLADFPFRVYSGQIPVADAARGVLIQLAWLAGLVALGAWAMSRVLKRAVIQGG